MAKSKGFTVEQKMEMRAAYEQGNILKVIAEKWQVSVPTMSKYISSVGGTLRNAGTPKKVKVQASNEVYNSEEPEKGFQVMDNRLHIIDPKDDGFDPAIIHNPNYGKPVVVPEPEVTTPQAPVARRILPFE